MVERHLVCAALVVVALVAGITPSHAVVGDCNDNGTADAHESLWANRDDDGDGVCNGVDNCPDEGNADQAQAPNGTGAACQMQAITVPAVPSDPAIPHLTYPGALITLKGIARYGGNQFMWEFGDGSGATSWMSITDPYDLGVTHAYGGGYGDTYVATLSVRSSSAPSVVATAAYPVQVVKGSDVADAGQLRARAQMAVDQALWYLHLNQQRSTAAEGTPGFRQPMGAWTSRVGSCAAIEALERHGSLADGNRRTDPYVEDVRRGLNRMFADAVAQALNVQSHGNPDVNADGYGVNFGQPLSSLETFQHSMCVLALADSGSPNQRAHTGLVEVHDQTHLKNLQDAVEFLAWGQNEAAFGEGGWGYYSNYGGSFMDATAMPMIALPAAEAGMGGVTVPTFVRPEALKYLTAMKNSNPDPGNGAWGFSTNTDYLSIATTAAGLSGLYFTGVPASDTRTVTGLGFIYRDWNGIANWPAQDNLGDSFSMFLLTSALARYGIRNVVEYDYVNHVQTANSFDWFYTPPGQAQTGYGKYLVTNQAANGAWPVVTGIIGGDIAFPYDAVSIAAFDALILESAPVLCGNAIVDANEQCDLGAANGSAATCCTTACRYRTASAACDDGDACTEGDACTAGGACAGSLVLPPAVGNDVSVSRSGGTSSANVAWTPGSYRNNVYRGVLLARDPWSYNQACFAQSATPPVRDSMSLPLGATAYYLVSNSGHCGESVLGVDSGGKPVPNASPCP